MVAIAIVRTGSKGMTFCQPPGDNPDAITEQGGISGVVDVALDDG
jgi:hypothetical protein